MSDEYLSEQLDALQAAYPKLHQLIGDDYFTIMGCRYFQRHPPAENLPESFAQQLSFFLKTEKPYSNVPSLAELVNFEAALHRSLSASEGEVVTQEYWQSLADELRTGMAFNLHSSLTILKLEWNAPQIWDALSSGKEVPEPASNTGFWIVYRGSWRSAMPLEVAALESVYHGLTYGELCSELRNLVDEIESVPMLTEKFVRSWVEQGLLLFGN